MTASTAARIDLVVPARNEETNIVALMRALPGGHPGGFFRHVVVADNGSADKTAELAAGEGAVVVHEAQPGYGAACLAGLGWIRERNPRSSTRTWPTTRLSCRRCASRSSPGGPRW
jgi:glycosyltransferase involved in cell wall biosynthesis